MGVTLVFVLLLEELALPCECTSHHLILPIPPVIPHGAHESQPATEGDSRDTSNIGCVCRGNRTPTGGGVVLGIYHG